MKSVYVFFTLALATVYGEGYSTKNDNFNMEEVVNNIDKLEVFSKCLNYEIGCTDVGKEFLKDIPDAVATSCTKCNDAQKNLFRLYIGAVKTKLPKEYEAFKKKFDPKGRSFDQLEANVGLVH